MVRFWMKLMPSFEKCEDEEEAGTKVDQSRFAEELQTDIGVARVRKWAKENHALKGDDIFISTNVDEVLNNNPKPILKVSF